MGRPGGGVGLKKVLTMAKTAKIKRMASITRRLKRKDFRAIGEKKESDWALPDRAELSEERGEREGNGEVGFVFLFMS